MKKVIIARFEVDEELEQSLFDSLQCESLRDFTKLPDTNALYESDDRFKELCKNVKSAKKHRDDYIHKYNSKQQK